jgi:hypothetical protein
MYKIGAQAMRLWTGGAVVVVLIVNLFGVAWREEFRDEPSAAGGAGGIGGPDETGSPSDPSIVEEPCFDGPIGRD